MRFPPPWSALILSCALAGCGDETSASGRGDTGAADAFADSTNDTTDATDAGDDAMCPEASLPRGEGEFRLGLAGAPLSLFGDEADPDFAGAFGRMADNGFNLFFPWFGTQEIDGVAEVSGHFDYFLPSDLTGPVRHCGRANPYEAAAGRMGILFPAFIFSDAAPEEAFDEAVFRERFASLQATCWGENEDVIVGFESFDEIATQRVVADFLMTPGPLVENAPRAATLLHELSDAPVYLIEGPLPLVIAGEARLSMAQRSALTELFWTNVETVVSGVDVFGFDVYPVPSEALSASGEYVREALLRAPDAERHIAVLQGFSYDAQSAGTDPRRGPTFEEGRFMAYDALVSGATELIWYGASALHLDEAADADVWEGVEALGRELREISTALDGSRVELDGGSLSALGFGIDGGLFVIVVNRADETVASTVELPATIGAVDDYATGEPLSLTGPRGSTLTLELEPYGVRLLMASNCP